MRQANPHLVMLLLMNSLGSSIALAGPVVYPETEKEKAEVAALVKRGYLPVDKGAKDHLGEQAKSRSRVFDRIPTADVVRRINDNLKATWAEHSLTPSDRSTDEEFIRRAYLDILGRIPSVEERNEFLKRPATNRRNQACEVLANSQESKNYWAGLWSRWLGKRLDGDGFDKTEESRLSGYFTTASYSLDSQMDLVVRELLAPQLSVQEHIALEAMKHNDKLALYTSPGPGITLPPGLARKFRVGEFINANAGEPDPMNSHLPNTRDLHPLTESISRNFLGVRLECVKCHDHPLSDRWKQSDYWNLNATLRGMSAVQSERTYFVPDQDRVERDHFVKYSSPGSAEADQKAAPAFIDGRPFLTAGEEGPFLRAQLADRIVHDPLFAKALVNRVWATMFGWGMNAPDDPDDFHVNSKHELEGVKMPKVMDALAKDFAAGGFRPHKLIEWICKSDAYSLSSRSKPKTKTSPGNQREEAEYLLARMPVKSQSFHQLSGSLNQLAYGTYYAPHGNISPGAELIEAGFRGAPGNPAKSDFSIQQQLALMHGTGVATTLLAIPGLHQTMRPETMERAFLATLGRKPTMAEREAAMAFAAPPTKQEKAAVLISHLEPKYQSARERYQIFVEQARTEEQKLFYQKRLNSFDLWWIKVKESIPKLVQTIEKFPKNAYSEIMSWERKHSSSDEFGREASIFIPGVQEYLTAKSNQLELYRMLISTNEFRLNH